ncbi:hypothetical protein [Pontimicrobium sp. SW4]|uniref:UDP-glycosyltransferase n=1 Tax=Pontimicrobium sp. SW4 TaxID=3153519 RepID=A0AAU7BVP4_9FLAO
MKNKKVILVVPDGTGIRNYLFSQIIPNLIKQNCDLLIYHALSNEALNEVEKLHNITLTKRPIPKYKEIIKQKFLREAICFGRLNYNSRLENNLTVLTNWKRNYKGLKKSFYKVVEVFGKYIGKNYQRILIFEEKYQKSLLKSIESEVSFLKEYNPSVIFCTHQRAINAIPIFKAAEVLGIKTVGAIYSWDNLVKARLAIRTREYIVWSNYMRDELLRYYNEIGTTNIFITGTPQFELYKDVEIVRKEDFFSTYGLDLNKTTICFSGDDELTSPHDPKYLEDFVSSIKESSLNGKVQIVFRRSPVDLSGRYNNIIKENKDLIFSIEPKWSNTQKQWTQLFPYFEDVELLANICKHCDLVINVGSTMAHDFAVFDNAAAYINYDVILDENWSTKTIYNYQHFKSMPEKDVVYWINSKEDYIKVIEKTLKNKQSLGKQWLETINCFDTNSAQAITQLLLN